MAEGNKTIQGKANEHLKIYQDKFAELRKAKLMLQEEAKILNEKIQAHETAEIQLQARHRALTELLEGLPALPAPEPAVSLPHLDETPKE